MLQKNNNIYSHGNNYLSLYKRGKTQSLMLIWIKRKGWYFVMKVQRGCEH